MAARDHQVMPCVALGQAHPPWQTKAMTAHTHTCPTAAEYHSEPHPAKAFPGQTLLATGRTYPQWCALDSPACPPEVHHYNGAPQTLSKYMWASPNLHKMENTSKRKKLRKHSQLKQQENSPKAVNNETDL